MKRLSSILKLEDSFNRVLKEERQGRKLIPDFLCFCDYQNNKNKIIHDIKTAIDKGQYSPQQGITMHIPRDNYCIRPGVVFSLHDLILYDAFSYYIGAKIDTKLNPRVLSYRFNKSGELIPGVKQWKIFENSYQKAFEEAGPESYMLITDITSYFANIHLEVLRDSILTLLDGPSKTDESIVNSLVDLLLKPWALTPRHADLGIPQGMNASSILGNLFLHHIDARMSNISKAKYFRYVDDIRIITPNKVVCKRILMELISALAEIGLDVNSSKTKIVEYKDFGREKDKLTEDIDLVENLVKSKKRDKIIIALRLLLKIFNEAFNKDTKDPLYQRHSSFAINRYILLRNVISKNKIFIKKIYNELISQLDILPGCTREFCRFFKNFPSVALKKEINEFLRSQNNVYEWQEMWLMDSLLNFNKMTLDDLKYFETISSDARKHVLCRAKATLLVGKFGDHHMRSNLATMYRNETYEIIKRSIIVACQELAHAERDTFYRMAQTDERISSTVNYIRNLRKPKYCEEEIWSPYDIPDWGTY